MGCLELDTSEHWIVCVQLTPIEQQNKDILYEDLFSDSTIKQAAITKLLSSLLERREDACASQAAPSQCPGEGKDSNYSFICNKICIV